MVKAIVVVVMDVSLGLEEDNLVFLGEDDNERIIVFGLMMI